MTADPVSPISEQPEGAGHQQDGDARDDSGAGSELSYDPEEPLFDGNGSDISGMDPVKSLSECCVVIVSSIQVC